MGSLPLAIDTLARASGMVLRNPRLVGIMAAGIATLVAVINVLNAVFPPGDSIISVAFFVFAINTVVVLFQGAIVQSTLLALRGERLGIFASVTRAAGRLGSFMAYALIMTVVTLVLVIIGDGQESLPLTLAGWALTMATYMAIPVLVSEGGSAVSAMTRSARLASGNMLAIWLVVMAHRWVGSLLIMLVVLLDQMGLPESVVMGTLIVGGLTLGTWGAVMTAVLYDAVNERRHRDGPAAQSVG